MDIQFRLKGVVNVNTALATAILEIKRPCDLFFRLNMTVPKSGERFIYEELFSITSTVSVDTFADYTPSLDDFKLVKYTRNIPTLLCFLKIIDNKLYLCISSDGEYTLSISQLSNEQRVIERAWIYPVRKEDNYKDAEYAVMPVFSYDTIKKITINYGDVEFNNYTAPIKTDSSHVIKITPTYTATPCYIVLYGYSSNNGINKITLKWISEKWYVKQDMFTRNPVCKVVDNILYFSDGLAYYFVHPKTQYNRFSIELVDKPQNWDEMATGNVISTNRAVGLRTEDIGSQNNILNNTVNFYEPTNRVGVVRNNKMYDAEGYDITYAKVGATSDRPSPLTTERGFRYFDITLGKPIWWNGTAWVDATGATV